MGSQAVSSPRNLAPDQAFQTDSTRFSPVLSAIRRTVSLLLSRQAFDGHWVGELQGDTILESEYILLLAFLGRERDKNVSKMAGYLLSQQMPREVGITIPADRRI